MHRGCVPATNRGRPASHRPQRPRRMVFWMFSSFLSWREHAVPILDRFLSHSFLPRPASADTKQPAPSLPPFPPPPQKKIVQTAGQEEFMSLQSQWISEGEGFIVVFSLINKTTFQAIERTVSLPLCLSVSVVFVFVFCLCVCLSSLLQSLCLSLFVSAVFVCVCLCLCLCLCSQCSASLSHFRHNSICHQNWWSAFER